MMSSYSLISSNKMIQTPLLSPILLNNSSYPSSDSNYNNNYNMPNSIRLPSITELFKDLPAITKRRSSQDIIPYNDFIYQDGPKYAKRYYNDYGNPISNKVGRPYKPRIRKSDYQTRVLDQIYSTNPFPNRKLRVYLASMLNLDQRNIQIWFQNKRQKRRV